MLNTSLLSYFNFYYGSKAHVVFPELQWVGGMSQLKKYEKILESSFFTGGNIYIKYNITILYFIYIYKIKIYCSTWEFGREPGSS